MDREDLGISNSKLASYDMAYRVSWFNCPIKFHEHLAPVDDLQNDSFPKSRGDFDLTIVAIVMSS